MDLCFECGSHENIVYHHVVPKSKGGKKTLPLCQFHHDIVHGVKPRNISLSNLIKEALKRAKDSGIKLGNPNVLIARKAAQEAIQERKIKFYINAQKAILEIQKNGIFCLSQIAEYLNEINYPTPRKGKWTATTVRRIMKLSRA